MTKRALVYPLLFLVGVSSAWTLGRLSQPDSGSTERRAASPDDVGDRSGPVVELDTLPLEESLADVRSILLRIEERLSANEAAIGEGTSARVPVGGASPEGLDALVQAIHELRDGLETHLKEDANILRNSRSLGSLREENPEAKWTELQRLIDLWMVDEERAKREMMLLSQKDVIHRFGSPSAVWSNDGGAHWVYGEGSDEEGKYVREVYLRFQDGYVTVLGVKHP